MSTPVRNLQPKHNRFADTFRPARQRLVSSPRIIRTAAAVGVNDTDLEKPFLFKQSFASIPFGLLIGLSIAWACTLRCDRIVAASTLAVQVFV